MPVLSSSSDIVATHSTPFEWPHINRAHPLAAYLSGWTYEKMAARLLWPGVVTRKLVTLQSPLPRKVYRRAERGRESGGDSAFGRLIAKPSKSINPDQFWSWFILQYHVHGKSFARKVRDRGGRPVELQLIHPSRMRYGPRAEDGYSHHHNVHFDQFSVFDGRGLGVGVAHGLDDGANHWWFRQSTEAAREVKIPRRDLLVWLRTAPSSPHIGQSMFEPLRDTLENEAGARAANKAMWRNGGRPQFVLSHPGVFNNPKVTKGLADQFQAMHGGVEQHGKPLVVQEGMKAIPMPPGVDMQYIEVRKLNREEVAAAADIPPPAIGILDRATFSNVTEQNRMLYRLTMPPHLTSFEAMIEFDLRDGSFGEGLPDFGDAFYFEHLVDGVLRGSFEERVVAFARAIQTGQITPAEVRELENRPFIEGSDRLYLNSAVGAIDENGDVIQSKPAEAAEPARAMDRTDADDAAVVPLGASARSTVMGRLSRPQSVAEIDVDRLVAGLDDDAAGVVSAAVTLARHADASVAELRTVLKGLGVDG